MNALYGGVMIGYGLILLFLALGGMVYIRRTEEPDEGATDSIRILAPSEGHETQLETVCAAISLPTCQESAAGAEKPPVQPAHPRGEGLPPTARNAAIFASE